MTSGCFARFPRRLLGLFSELREGHLDVVAPFLYRNGIFDLIRELEGTLIVCDSGRIVACCEIDVADVGDANLVVRQGAKLQVHAFCILEELEGFAGVTQPAFTYRKFTPQASNGILRVFLLCDSQSISEPGNCRSKFPLDHQDFSDASTAGTMNVQIVCSLAFFKGYAIDTICVRV